MKIAIISPASPVNPDYIDGAVAFFNKEGAEVLVMPHAKGPAAGSYAARDEDRLDDFIAAWSDPSVDALLCARGGYGCNHLIEKIPVSLLAGTHKWLIGFSDVSALHAMLRRARVRSIHGPMAKHLSSEDHDHYCSQALMRILRNDLPMEYLIPPHPFNRPGTAEGTLLGGNLAVLNGLADTPFDILSDIDTEPMILFIEDISEAIYAVERMLIRLHLSGKLARIKGLIVGQFTEYRPDRNFPDMEAMISALLTRTGISCPVAFGFPCGHTPDNLPLIEGARAILEVTPTTTRLIME